MLMETLLVLAIGLIFGSFVTLASYRLPRDEDIIREPSRCPSCAKRLGFKDLWPLVSWAISNGRCRYCKADIPARYPMIEFVTASLFLMVYERFGFTPHAAILAALGVVLLIMVIVDFGYYIIPDEVHYVLLPLGIAYHFSLKTPPLEVAIGFGVALGLGLLLHYGYRFLRKKDGLGFGDVKFLAVAGLWLTFKGLPPFLFFSGLAGVATGFAWQALGKGKLFPFGPAMAVSLLFCLLFTEYSNLFWNIVFLVK